MDPSKHPLMEDQGKTDLEKRGIKVFKEQLMVVLMRRLLRAKGKSTGQIKIPASEVDDTAQLMMYFQVTDDEKHFVLTLGKKQ